MDKKSKFELEIVAKSISIRVKHGKSQAYIAMILNVTEGYIGQVESPNFPAMYTHDQINAIALDLGCSPKDFYPDQAVQQDLPKTNLEEKKERLQLIEKGIIGLINKGYFKEKRYVRDTIAKLEADPVYTGLNLTNKDITDILRPLTKVDELKSERIANRNVYWKE